MSDKPIELRLNAPSPFTVPVEVEGAIVSEARGYLLIDVPDENAGTVTLQFEGRLNDDGQFVFTVPPMKRFLDENATGRAQVKIVAGDLFFDAISTTYEVLPLPKVKASIFPARNVVVAEIQDEPEGKLINEIVHALIEKGISGRALLPDNPDFSANKTIINHTIQRFVEASQLTPDVEALTKEVVTRLAR